MENGKAKQLLDRIQDIVVLYRKNHKFHEF